MHFSFWEKSGFAVLIAAWVVWGSIQVGNALVHPTQLAENAYPIEVADSGSGGGAESAAAVVEESAVGLMASFDSAAGAKVFKKCAGCHTVEQGGPNKVGPNLWGVVDANKGVHDGYSYSAALLAVGGTWSYENLDKFLKSPKNYAPGNKMTFGGLKKASDRAKVILYLRDNHSNPPPLPQ